jgi:hypothetical protein
MEKERASGLAKYAGQKIKSLEMIPETRTLAITMESDEIVFLVLTSTSFDTYWKMGTRIAQVVGEKISDGGI